MSKERQQFQERGMEMQIKRLELQGDDAEQYRQAQRSLWLVEDDVDKLIDKAICLLPKLERDMYFELRSKQTDLDGDLLKLTMPKPNVYRG